MAKGTLSKMSDAVLSDEKASNNKMKMSNNDNGTTTLKRCMARSWFSNSPDHVSL